MEKYRFKESIKASYVDQGYIFFLCRRYHRLPLEQRRRIDWLIRRAGGEHAAALREAMTTDGSILAVSQKHHISESTLERVVRRFYELAAGDL